MPSRAVRAFTTGLWNDNPIFRQVLGICSTLAITNLMSNTVVMCLGLIYATAFSAATVSLLRNVTPNRVRMMVQVLIISAYVIVLDLFLKAFLPEISRNLGPYVGLIITNCIVMGRCEAFARQNPPFLSFLDGVGCGLGYSLALLFVAFFRELTGFGTILGFHVLGGWWTRWTIMVMPPGAFFMLAVAVWLARGLSPSQPQGTPK